MNKPMATRPIDHRPTSIGEALLLITAGAVMAGTIIVLALPAL